MPPDIFKDIITLEKELRDRLASEKEKADAWLADQYNAMGEEMQNRLHTLEQNVCREKEAFVSQAEKEATQIVALAKHKADELKNVEKSYLQVLIRKNLSALLPGKS